MLNAEVPGAYALLVARCLLAVSLWLSAAVFAAADYVGGQQCQACHSQEYSDWQGSQHQKAMQLANDQTVLGDFGNKTFSKDGVTTTFFKQQGRLMVNTEGPDGSLHDYPISYVFGVYPLQQYMVNFPHGKIQVLDIAWDSRPADKGGQRWFSLHPDEPVPAGDILHWTGPNLNWNYMCADCHSTDLHKNYDLASDSYDSRWTDISVSCEACHGPGSEHIAWARNAADGEEVKRKNRGLSVLLDERKGVQWGHDSQSGLPVRSQPNQSRAEIEVCARCLSRRGQQRDDFVPGQPFMDAYRPALLTEGLYHADGQMQDEVYVWGSFRQSKMYRAGVTCSDCHNPHSAELKAPGPLVCAQCHSAAQYASKKHHFHAPDSAGANCINCHMPASTLMQVDERNDHSFRIPRPDVSLKQGSPNACNQCHTDKNANWALQKMKKWYGTMPRGYQDFSAALGAARQGGFDSADLLLRLAADTTQSDIARATAYQYLGARPGQDSLMLIQQGLNDDDPLLRQGALTALASVPPRQRLLALPLVWDDVRSIRIQAARLMAGYPGEPLRQDRQAKVDAVLEEYIQTQLFNGERPEAQLNLADLYQDQKKFVEAERAYRKALQLQPQFVPAYLNFAQLLSTLGRETEAHNLLETGLAEVPESADLYHARGLARVRQKQTAAAIEDLDRAAQLAPENRRYQYVYAVALQSTGRVDKAIGILQASLARRPADPDVLFALATFNRDAGNRSEALKYARQLQALIPGNPDIDKLVLSLQP